MGALQAADGFVHQCVAVHRSNTSGPSTEKPLRADESAQGNCSIIRSIAEVRKELDGHDLQSMVHPAVHRWHLTPIPCGGITGATVADGRVCAKPQVASLIWAWSRAK